MTNKIRMRMGPLSVMSTIAVIGLLAAFIALTAMPGGAYAPARRRWTASASASAER